MLELLSTVMILTTMTMGPTEYQAEAVKQVREYTSTPAPGPDSALYTLQHIKDSQSNIDAAMASWVGRSVPYNPYQ